MPKLKNSALAAMSPARSAALGNSIMVPTRNESLAPVSASTSPATSMIDFFRISSSRRLTISGIMISGVTTVSISLPMATAASKIARACMR